VKKGFNDRALAVAPTVLPNAGYSPIWYIQVKIGDTGEIR